MGIGEPRFDLGSLIESLVTVTGMRIMRLKLHKSGWRPAAIAAASLSLLLPSPAFAGGYWSAFAKYWSGFVADADGVIITVLIVGVISLIIITRGKWAK